ncbi:hypothetical protein JOB18_045815 [Solea senegalensis]|uniref:Uncharacterized protein n=1 Tax=Solea senegalensis TaxID=28829 RepID=A0AAV6Q4E4_SOLSE|nr:hypothetical protein JOB18_045815 [Solea senegalensis]
MTSVPNNVPTVDAHVQLSRQWTSSQHLLMLIKQNLRSPTGAKLIQTVPQQDSLYGVPPRLHLLVTALAAEVTHHTDRGTSSLLPTNIHSPSGQRRRRRRHMNLISNAATLIHQTQDHSTVLAVLDGKAPEPSPLSRDTVAGLTSPCLSRKPQMSRKPLDISVNHSSLNKHFLNDLREKRNKRQTHHAAKQGPRPLTNLNPN